MNHRTKNLSNFEPIACEKLLNRLIRQEKVAAQGNKKTPIQYQEKLSALSNKNATQQRTKIKQPSGPARTLSPTIKQTPPIRGPSVSPTRGTSLSPTRKEVVCEKINLEPLRSFKHRHRSASSSASACEREPWGQMLLQHKSRERISSFSNFDPLRTLHFLSKELYVKLQSLIPENNEVHQMITDIQHALKRIPPEIASLVHLQQHCEFSLTNTVSTSSKSINLELPEKLQPIVATKQCQTPPTLYQEDTERFQKLMEENTIKLEASIKQLEVMCANLQSEKETSDKELEEARQHVSILCKKIKELETEIEDLSNIKLQRLEQEKSKLQKDLERAHLESRDNPTLNHLKKLVDELRIEKSNADQKCARLEYDLTLLSMEKEKLTTVLAVRDKEIRDIQEEMSRIQDQVSKELKRLNSEVLSRTSSLKTVTAKSRELLQENKENVEGVGDATISSIASNETTANALSLIKESPCGDAEIGVLQENQENILEKLAQIKTNAESDPSKVEQDEVLEEILRDLTPSCKALFKKPT